MPAAHDLAVEADAARARGDVAAAARLRLAVLRAVLDLGRRAEPRLGDLDPAQARRLQDWQDEVRELLIDPDRWPVGDTVFHLVGALAAVQQGTPW